MTVRVYRSTDFGAPVLNGQTGSLAAVLDACLVNGYGSLSITSLTQTGGIATAVCDSPHGYKNKPKVLIAGANESGFNGEVIATITSATNFTYLVDSGTASPATGAITVKRKGSDWTKEYGTTIAAYKQPASGPSNHFYLRLDDATAGNVARLTGYETMTDANTGTNDFPSTAQFTGGLYCFKSSTTDTTPREWVLLCNGPMFYLAINQASVADWATTTFFAFGDISSYKPGDIYHTLIAGSNSSGSSASTLQTVSSSLSSPVSATYMARTHATTGTSITLSKHADTAKMQGGATIGASGMGYPSLVDGGLYVSPVWVAESATNLVRGILPGFFAPLHARPLGTGDVWEAAGELAGKTFEAINTPSGGQLFFEISDTW